MFCFSKMSKKNETFCHLEKGKKSPLPPFGLEIFKGYKNVIVRRDRVDFIINHPVAKEFRIFLKPTYIPDEHLFATVDRIEHVREIFNKK